jgi:glycosyltransferase involved in cell wall biosynthesis
VPPREPAAFAGILRDLAENPELRAKLGRHGRMRVETQFSLDRMVRAYGNIYARLA